MDKETQRFWEGATLAVVVGVVCWALVVYWYCTTFGPAAAERNEAEALRFCNSAQSMDERQQRACDRRFRRLSCDTAEFNPDFTPAQREACRQRRKQL